MSEFWMEELDRSRHDARWFGILDATGLGGRVL